MLSELRARGLRSGETLIERHAGRAIGGDVEHRAGAAV